MYHLQMELKKWNKDTFGNIFRRKKTLLDKLESVDARIAITTSATLEDTRARLWREYETVLMQEEILWFQKSRAKWLEHGDRNTKYFHGVTTIRRRRNKYDMLQDDIGTWVSDPKTLEALASQYFKNLFQDEGMCVNHCLRGAFPRLSQDELADLA